MSNLHSNQGNPDMNHSTTGRNVLRRAAVSAALATLFAGPVAAFEIDTGVPDLDLRWDNTIRYNAGMRAQKQSSAILGAPNNDDGDRNFGNGSLVTSRFDLLSEFDAVWQKSYGARFSAALWWDPAYNNLDNTNAATSNTLVDGLPVAGALSPFTKRYAKGPSAEWLDAFAFANFDVADIPVSIKAGQHTVFWGDSLLLNGAIHSVSYAQNSIDIWKGLATPGSEAKELFRPKGGLTLQAQPLARAVARGPVVLQLAGGAHPGIGQLPHRGRLHQLRRRFAHLRAEPVRGVDSRRARRTRASGTRTSCRSRATARASATSAFPRAGARIGSTARWASTTAMRPTSSRRRW